GFVKSTASLHACMQQHYSRGFIWRAPMPLRCTATAKAEHQEEGASVSAKSERRRLSSRVVHGSQRRLLGRAPVQVGPRPA
uniref:Uncharacterized protein n=1 Tax=Aegilops tauschii subsp. strangulata TaxID=200361 RepID=A0A453CVJ0_AEGTS